MKADVRFLVGTRDVTGEPWEIFADPVLEFLNELSGMLRRECRDLPELAAFGFWCRKSRMLQDAKRFEDGVRRMGRGKVFHFPASNVPGLFAYSLVMGLLAGNSNYIRLSSKVQEADFRLCEVLARLLERPEFSQLAGRISIFSCDREHSFIDECLEECSGCVAWGGDTAIRAIRSRPMNPDAVQLMFPDRYSVSILDAGAVEALDETELGELAHRFYNDTYAMDQNACSSPCVVVWNGTDGSSEQAGERFWKAVSKKAEEYSMTAQKATDKYERLCRYVMTLEEEARVRMYGNRLYTVKLSGIPREPGKLKVRFGVFFEYEGDWEEALAALSGRRLQTVTCYGVDAEAIQDCAVRRKLSGILRTVPVGQALEMDLVWDGQNVIELLSRQLGRRMCHEVV